VKRRYFRGDAAFANPENYEFLEAEGYGYVNGHRSFRRSGHLKFPGLATVVCGR
jgi:hypothetical protein